MTTIFMDTAAPSLAVLGFTLGPPEIIITLVVVLLLFGSRIPKLARSLGQGIVEFRKGLKGESEEPNELPGKRDASLPRGNESSGDSVRQDSVRQDSVRQDSVQQHEHGSETRRS